MNYYKKYKMNLVNLFSVVSVVLTALILCSCDSLFHSDSSKTEENAASSVTAVSPQKEVVTSYGYDNLSSDKLKELYMKIDEYAEKADNSMIAIDSPLEQRHIEEAVEAYKNDHPEVFWLSSIFSYTENENGYCSTIRLEYNTDSSELEQAKADFNKALKTAVDGAPKNASAYELELYANDYLVENCVYDKEAAKADEIKGNENDAYGALVEKKAVCEGYSRAFQLLCNELGIDCINISGTADGESHSWNNVMLGGEWYEVDVTWNDTDGETEFPMYTYFNMPSDKFSESHSTSALYSKISSSEYNKNSDIFYNIFAPECTGTKYYYYSYSCVTVDDLEDSEEISKAIAQSAKKGDEYLSFAIDEGLDYYTAADEIIFDGYLADWIADANKINNDTPNLNNECYVYRSEDISVITIIFEYL